MTCPDYRLLQSVRRSIEILNETLEIAKPKPPGPRRTGNKPSSRRSICDILGPMDRTLDFYDTNADTVAATYEQVEFAGVLRSLIPFFPETGCLLEIGAGSGRDAVFWLNHGFDVTAIDGSHAMVEEALKMHPELRGRLTHHVLPAVLPYKDRVFDIVVSMAMIMHLAASEIPLVFTEIARVLSGGGICAYSVNTARSGLDASGYDDSGRRFTCLPAKEWEALHVHAGFETVHREENDDVSGRAGISWVTLVARKRWSK